MQRMIAGKSKQKRTSMSVNDSETLRHLLPEMVIPLRTRYSHTIKCIQAAFDDVDWNDYGFLAQRD